MSLVLRYVPWCSQSDWQNVYDDAYSDDPERQAKACKIMDVWMYNPNDCPPAVGCTRSLIAVMLKDPEINPSAELTSDLEDLRLLYSSAVMRTINTVTGSGKKKRVTMKQCGSTLGIPDWIVSLRNRVSHGSAGFVELSVLRSAAVFLRQWLQEYYWEVERTESQDWVIERPRRLAVEENLRALLRIYVHVKKTAALCYESIAKIENPQIKSAICSMAQYRVSVTYAEIMPWDARGAADPKGGGGGSEDDGGSVHPKAVEEMPPRNALKRVLGYCRPYLATDFWHIDTASILVDAIIEENSDCTDLKRRVWSCLVQAVHRWGRLGALMSALAKAAGDRSGSADRQRIASAWLHELLLASAKRIRADQLRDEFTRDCESGGSAEARIARRLVLRRRLNMRLSKEASSALELMRRVGKAEPHLKDVIRLVDAAPVRLNNHAYRDILMMILESPNRYSLQCISPLTDLFEPRMRSRDVSLLHRLVNIYVGNVESPPAQPGVATFSVRDIERIQRQKVRNRTGAAAKCAEDEGEDSGDEGGVTGALEEDVDIPMDVDGGHPAVD